MLVMGSLLHEVGTLVHHWHCSSSHVDIDYSTYDVLWNEYNSVVSVHIELSHLYPVLSAAIPERPIPEFAYS
jgi:hypothetical protein